MYMYVYPCWKEGPSQTRSCFAAHLTPVSSSSLVRHWRLLRCRSYTQRSNTITALRSGHVRPTNSDVYTPSDSCPCGISKSINMTMCLAISRSYISFTQLIGLTSSWSLWHITLCQIRYSPTPGYLHVRSSPTSFLPLPSAASPHFRLSFNCYHFKKLCIQSKRTNRQVYVWKLLKLRTSLRQLSIVSAELRSGGEQTLFLWKLSWWFARIFNINWCLGEDEIKPVWQAQSS